MGKQFGRVDGVIVIRVWFEEHPDFPLRAVVNTTTTDGREVATASAKSAGEVCAAVAEGLEGLAGPEPDGTVTGE